MSSGMKEVLTLVKQACEKARPLDDQAYLGQEFNSKVLKAFRERGLMGMHVSAKYNGPGLNAREYFECIKAIGEVGTSLRTLFSVHSSIAQPAIEKWGSEEQKRKYLPKSCTGEITLAFALTEPLAGSDPSSLKTTYELKGGKYVLNGEKAWISHGLLADSIITFARNKKNGKISSFIVDRKSKGYSTKEIKHKLGLHSIDTARIYFKDCIVPKENLLGPEGKGLTVAFSSLMNGRLSVAAGCVGVMRDCLREAVSRAKTRVQHGKEIGKHQLIQRHIALISTNLSAGEALLDKAITKKMELEQNPNEKLRTETDALIARAKYYCTNAALEAANSAVQVWGAEGYSFENRVARHLADIRATTIYEGTNEVMEQKIALAELGREFYAFK